MKFCNYKVCNYEVLNYGKIQTKILIRDDCLKGVQYSGKARKTIYEDFA